MADLEHPDITQALKTGYPNLVAQPEHAGTDYFGNEILIGDSIIIDHKNGETILEDSLEDYLMEVLGFQFRTAE
ncbi:YqaI family protein [Peribacillus sp. NPDC076916]|uniref:YqaI family protein n=1 Tax=Peribacillus sp. NPDC076916 TaxID=3390608 RepID=UPI003D0412A5